MMRFLLVFALVTGGTTSAVAQLPQTRLYSLFPPGVQPGKITDVHVHTGADLDEVDGLVADHPGIFATQKQQPDGHGGFTPITNAFRVAVEADVPPGRYEVRAVGLFGTSNPRGLIVDPRPSVLEAEPNNTAQQAQAIEVGTLVDGQISVAGDLDLVRFSAKQGERIVIDCLAERIDSKLNPIVTLANADNKPVAFARNEYGRDSFLVYDVPADGDYFVQLHDETFSGSAEHIYRLQIHKGPHIRFVMPPAGLPGTTAHVALYGYNLPGGQQMEAVGGAAALEKLEVELPIPAEPQPTFGIPSVAAGLDLFPYRFESEGQVSNPVLLGLASAPVSVEQEPNDEPSAAQKLAVPFEAAGQLTSSSDVDRFSFDAEKGEQLWIEVIGQRLNPRMDPQLVVERIAVDANGVEQATAITTQDDTATNLAANVFDTATDDPAYMLVAPEAGTYRLTLRNLASGAEPDPSQVYRLIVRPPVPDFRLVAVPAGQSAGQTWPVSPRRGDHFALNVLAFRRDGFTGAIEVRPLDLPPGLTTKGTVIRENETSATLVLTASESAATDPAEVRLVGSAQVTTPQGPATIEHPVRFGSMVWSLAGTTPAISQLENELVATVVPEAAPFEVTFDFARSTLKQGRQLLIPMTLARRGFNEAVTLKFDPAVVKATKTVAPDVVFAAGQTQQMCRLFIPADAPPGTYVLGGTSTAQVPYSRNPLKAEAAATAKTIAEREAQIAKAAADELTARVAAQTTTVQQADAAVAAAQAAQAAAQTTVDQTQAAIVAAKQANDEAAKQVAALTEEVKQLTAKLDEATKASAAAADDEALKTQAAQAKQAVDEKQAALATAQQAQTTAQEQVTQAEAAVKPAADALAAAQQATTQAQATQTVAQQLNAQLTALSQAATAKAQATEAARAAAEKAAAEAAKAATPANVAVVQPIPPMIVTIQPAPVALTAAPAKGEIKAGETVDVTVTVKRQNDFAGPVKLSLAVPEGVAGLSAAEVEVAPDAETAVLKVTATDAVPEGDVANLVVRGTMDAGGEAVVDAPLAIKVTK